MNIFSDCRKKYYSNDDIESIIMKIKDNINFEIQSISEEMFCIFYDFLYKEPSCYWNNEIYNQTYTNLKNNYKNITFNEEIIEHFIIGYNTYYQITDIINDLSQLNDSDEIKNRLYRIPTYISIVEGCLTNLYRVITLIIDQNVNKDIAAQKKIKSFMRSVI